MSKLIKEGNGWRYGRMIQPWLVTKESLIRDTPSRRDGISYEEELYKRQAGGVFIFDLVMRLTNNRGEHGLSGVAMTLFHRFFTVHSLKRVDYRDVAAACVFLAGKNEDTPKKLKYVVNVLYLLKFPQNRQPPATTNDTFIALSNVVTFLEEMVLKSIAFDLNIDLPHQCVLKLMQHVEKGRNTYKEMVKSAYFLATDCLLITDWSCRYSCAAIATACVNIAAFFHNIEMDKIVPLDVADSWYRFQDNSISRGDVEVMTKEFLNIYARIPQFHVGNLKKIDMHGRVKIIGKIPSTHRVTSSHPSSSSPIPSSGPSSTSQSSSNSQKKIDLDAYRGRGKMETPPAPVPGSRPNFLPDMRNPKVVEQNVNEMKMREAEHAKALDYQKRQREQHMKRPHADFDIMNEGSKKARMVDYRSSFVAASSTVSHLNGNSNNGTKHVVKTEKVEMSEYAIGVSKMMNSISMKSSTHVSAYQQKCMELKRQSAAHEQVTHLAPSSTQQISPPDDSSPVSANGSIMTYLPPPPPPPVLYPLHVHDEMEEGELR